MVNQEKVQDYRNGSNDSFQYLILYHRPIADEIVRQYVSRQFPFEDLQEYAHYALVEIIIKAREKLVDNNITYYIRRRLRQRLLDHIKFERKSGTYSELLTKQPFTDVASKRDADISIMFRECCEKAIKNDLQKQIVELHMQGHTFSEISSLLKVPESTAAWHWGRFTNDLENCYAK